MQEYIDNKKKRGVVYKYPLDPKDISKIPRFTDSPFRYFVVQNAYDIWKKLVPDVARKQINHIRVFEKMWKEIADAIYFEMEENLDGVELPEQMGIFYIGTPANKTYFNLVDLAKYKYIIWGAKIKYFNKRLKYYIFHTTKGRFKSAYEREDYYKTAKERISNFKLY